VSGNDSEPCQLCDNYCASELRFTEDAAMTYTDAVATIKAYQEVIIENQGYAPTYAPYQHTMGIIRDRLVNAIFKGPTTEELGGGSDV
jgi:hypothetical protein